MDNIISWNIKGLNNPKKQEDLRIFFHMNKVVMMGLLETKVQRHNIDLIVERLFPGLGEGGLQTLTILQKLEFGWLENP